ncbi:MAG TPA: nuclear transport factor 2 family protein [Chitinophagaceae bacterium]|nr:nuclear transport factor 2 family protein [Chitinophagaceae bacterium]
MKSILTIFTLFINVMAAAQQPSSKKTTSMKNYSTDSTDIARILTDTYFKGIYEGNVPLLETAYYPGTLLFGDAAGKPYFKTLAQYLDGVKNRQSPKDSGKPFEGDIFSIEIINSIAVAKVRVKMYDFNYFELLSFHRLDGKWVIVNKMISDVEQ